jgi:hypothetical protein
MSAKQLLQVSKNKTYCDVWLLHSGLSAFIFFIAEICSGGQKILVFLDFCNH